MSYWDKIKELLSLSSKPEEKEEDAEEHQNEPEHPAYPGHFKDARIYNFENEDDAGKIYDIQAAALQRLSNIGTKKRKNTIPTSEE